MERAEKVKTEAVKMIETGRKPSAAALSSQLNFSDADIHRCLNFLESNGEIETYTREVLGNKHRMIGVKR